MPQFHQFRIPNYIFFKSLNLAEMGGLMSKGTMAKTDIINPKNVGA